MALGSQAAQAAPAPDPTTSRSRPQRLARLEAPSPQHDRANAVTGPAADPCQALLASDPSAAGDYARDWAGRGGGDQAAQCGALADIALGDPARGGATLDTLSRRPDLPGPRRAVLADEAGQAWLLATDASRALASADRAVALAPGDLSLLADHGRVALAANQPAGAVADLSAVLAARPNDADALVARATAYRRLGRLAEARTDIDAAGALTPDQPEVLLERGVLRERTGDEPGARTDWTRILSVAPDTHEADLAQQDLALLDAGPDAR